MEEFFSSPTYHLSIHPGYQFSTPQVIFSNSLTHTCPSIHLLHWDCPIELPNQVREFIQELDDTLKEDSYNFLDCIDSWFQLYWNHISPNSHLSKQILPPYSYTYSSPSPPSHTCKSFHYPSSIQTVSLRLNNPDTYFESSNKLINKS